jgi:hypothetical protein
MLVRFSGKTQREVAERLGLSTGAAVSVQLRGLSEREKKEPSILKGLDRLEKSLRLVAAEAKPVHKVEMD